MTPPRPASQDTSNTEEIRAELYTTQQQLKQLERERDTLSRELAAIHRSRSWLLTRPMRHAGDQARRLRALLTRPASPSSPLVLAAPAQSTRQRPAAPIDVIVPVYKGLEETRACLESVWRSTPTQPYRLVVINDASPEPEVSEWLREVATEHEDMLLLENPENLGFVGTVNRGMALSSQADVVLLNSDAEVANDWLDRLTRAAYQENQYPAGTVTPFSNNATICSYPRFCEDNELPPGYDLPRLDRLFAEVNAGQTVDIPTGIGFCMYIRRDCLDAIGLFDEAHFGKGYGEENDFCMRALKSGWRNVHTLDVFAWHKGSVSFGASNNERMAKALRVLHELHPDFDTHVHRFIARDPAREARRAVDMSRIRRDSRPLVLFVSHQRGGGVDLHCRELAHHFAAEAQFLSLKPAREHFVDLSLLDDAEGFETWFRLPDEQSQLLSALQALGVQMVHFHHTLGHDDWVTQLPALLDVPQVVTLHDYYALCRSITLTDAEGRYREPPVETSAQATSASDTDQVTREWRARHRDWLSRSCHIIAPSQDTAERFRKYYPDLAIQAVSPLDNLAASQRPPVMAAREHGEPLRIAVLGALSKEKGADLLEAVAKAAQGADTPLHFRLFGYAYRNLSTGSTLSVTGPYEQDQLAELLTAWSPHVVWFPSQCPETYSYTLSVCLALGLPVVSTDLGAIPERIGGRPYSWVLPYDTTPDAWCDWFTRLAESTPEPNVASRPVAESADAFYRRAYLPAFRQRDASVPLPSPGSLRLQDPLHEHSSARARQTLVDVLYRLRQSAFLQPIVKLIPTRLQRRVKTLLLRESG